jgi:hypothetical protein
MSSQHQPEDQPADDRPEEPDGHVAGSDQAEDQSAGAQEEKPAEDARLEELSEHIDTARSRAEDAGVLDDPDQEEYVDSGLTEDEDDQTIAPPG